MTVDLDALEEMERDAKESGEWFAAVAITVVLIGTMFFGSILNDAKRDGQCEKGVPVVINGKVYECKERK